MAIPVWATAANNTTIAVQLLSANASGVLASSGSLETLYGSVQEVVYHGVLRTEQVNPLTDTRQSEHPVERDDFWTLAEILKADDANAYHASAPQYNILAKLWAAHLSGINHVQITFIRGGTGVSGGPGGNSYVFVGLIQSYNENHSVKGQRAGRMTVQVVDEGDTAINPTYAVSADPA